MKICSFKGCERKYRAKGLCVVHYNMYNKGKELHDIGPQGRPPGCIMHKKCSVDGCLNKHKAKGWCSAHYNQILKHRIIQKSRKRNSHNSKICTVDDCGLPGFSLDFCSKHYQRYKKFGTTDLPPRLHKDAKRGSKKKTKQKCDVDNCDNFSIKKGFCDQHYKRYRKFGDPLTCYRRSRKSSDISLDNILKDDGCFSKTDDAEALREHFGNIFDDNDQK